MSTPKGYSSQEKEDRLSAQFSTVEPVKNQQFGLSTVSYSTVQEWAVGTVDAGSSASVLVITDCAPSKGEIIHFTTGALQGTEVRVWEVDGTSFSLAETLPVAPSAGDSIQVLRHKSPLVNGNGELVVALSELAIEEVGGPLADSKVKMAGGLDTSGDVRYLTTDPDGHLQVDVLSSALPSGAATSAAQTDGSQKTQIVDGSGNVISSTGNALDVNLKTPITVDVQLSQANDSVAVFGSDGAVNRALKTDANGELQIDVLSSALPSGAATESTLANVATSANQTNGNQKSQLVDGSGDIADVVLLSTGLQSTDKGLVTNTIIHGETTGGGGGYVDVKVTPSGAMVTETTLAGLDAAILGQDTMANSLPMVIASDQTAIPVTDNGSSLTVDGSVSISSSALPAGAATETTLADIKTSVQLLDNTVSGNELQVDVVAPLPSGTNTIGKVDVNTLSVIDLLDAGILDTSSTNIAGSASSPTQVVASTAAATKKMQILDTTGAFIGLYTGAVSSEVLQLVIGPGSDQTIEHAIPAATRISLKRLDSTTAISSGIVAINFIG